MAGPQANQDFARQVELALAQSGPDLVGRGLSSALLGPEPGPGSSDFIGRSLTVTGLSGPNPSPTQILTLTIPGLSLTLVRRDKAML